MAEEGAAEMGAEVRICKVPELAQQSAIDANQAWKAHLKVTEDVPVVSLEAIMSRKYKSFYNVGCGPALVVSTIQKLYDYRIIIEFASRLVITEPFKLCYISISSRILF